MAETEYRVSVKPGGWAKYDGWVYQRRDVFQGDLEPIPAHGLNDTITIRVLKISGTNVTWREVRRRLDGLVHFDETLTADPTKPYYWPPEYKVHTFFIPSNLETGELIPQPLGWDPFKPGWPQYVNETIVKSLFGVKRQVNHIQSHRVHTFEGSEREFIRDHYFDKKTGLMVEYFSNYTHTRYTGDQRIESIYVETHHYRIKDTNFWRPLWMRWELYVTVLGITIFTITVVTLKRRRR